MKLTLGEFQSEGRGLWETCRTQKNQDHLTEKCRKPFPCSNLSSIPRNSASRGMSQLQPYTTWDKESERTLVTLVTAVDTCSFAIKYPCSLHWCWDQKTEEVGVHIAMILHPQKVTTVLHLEREPPPLCPLKKELLLQVSPPEKKPVLYAATYQGSGLPLYSLPWSWSQSCAMMTPHSYSTSEPEPLLSATLPENEPLSHSCQRNSFCHKLQKEGNNKG